MTETLTSDDKFRALMGENRDIEIDNLNNQIKRKQE
jgi:hypothetical protein